jgi:hypothetical protein
MPSSDPTVDMTPKGNTEVASLDPDQLGFLTSLASAPCFRDTALYSIGGGTALAALHLHRNRTYYRELGLKQLPGLQQDQISLLSNSGCTFVRRHHAVCRGYGEVWLCVRVDTLVRHIYGYSWFVTELPSELYYMKPIQDNSQP